TSRRARCGIRLDRRSSWCAPGVGCGGTAFEREHDRPVVVVLLAREIERLGDDEAVVAGLDVSLAALEGLEVDRCDADAFAHGVLPVSGVEPSAARISAANSRWIAAARARCALMALSR